MAHGDAVVDGNGVELLGDPAGGLDPFGGATGSGNRARVRWPENAQMERRHVHERLSWVLHRHQEPNPLFNILNRDPDWLDPIGIGRDDNSKARSELRVGDATKVGAAGLIVSYSLSLFDMFHAAPA